MKKFRKRFSFGNLQRKRVSHNSIRLITAIQDEPLEYLAASLGLVLKTLCAEKQLSQQDIMTAADNMLRTTGLEDDGIVTALRSFIREEIPS